MRYGKSFFLIILIFLLSGCVEKAETADSKLVIQPYRLSEKEHSLISKTDVQYIEYFILNGVIKENDTLKISTEVYVKGKLKEEILEASIEEDQFQNTFISFGTSSVNEKSLKLINGLPSGLATTFYSNNMTANTFNKLINEKITLEKNKPVYLAAWQGTKNNGELSGSDNGNGELPESVKSSELAFVYKVLWTDK